MRFVGFEKREGDMTVAVFDMGGSPRQAFPPPGTCVVPTPNSGAAFSRRDLEHRIEHRREKGLPCQLSERVLTSWPEE